MTLSALSPQAGWQKFGACAVAFTGEELALANPFVERRWRLSDGLLTPLSLKDRVSGREWLARPGEQPAPLPAVPLPDEPRQVAVSVGQGGAVVHEARVEAEIPQARGFLFARLVRKGAP